MKPIRDESPRGEDAERSTEQIKERRGLVRQTSFAVYEDLGVLATAVATERRMLEQLGLEQLSDPLQARMPD